MSILPFTSAALIQLLILLSTSGDPCKLEQEYATQLVLIQTTYMTQSVSGEASNVVENVGTGFIVDRSGLVVAPQHVLRPWLYDRKILALIDLGIIQLVPGSARFSVWQVNQQEQQAYTLGAAGHNLLILYAEEPTTVARQLESNFGSVTIQEAVSDETDILILQLQEPDSARLPLLLDPNTASAGCVTIIGLHLKHGIAIAQSQPAKIRHNDKDFIELEITLQPGASGSPILSGNGGILGMVIAYVEDESYGIALSSTVINDALAKARDRIKRQEQRLREQGCNPGVIDGMFDEILWRTLESSECMYFQNK